MAATRDNRPYAAVWACVAMWGFSGILVKSTDVAPLVASFYRLWFGVAILWSVTLLRGRTRQTLRWQWLKLCAFGGLFFGVHQILFFESLEATRVANVTIIASLQPALVAFLAARLFDEPVPWHALPFLGVAIAGIAVVVMSTSGLPGVHPYGDALAIANLFAFVGYFLASKRIRDELSAAEYITGMTTVAALVLSTALLVTGQAPTPPSPRDALILFVIAALPGTVGHTLMTWAHPHLPAFTISTTILAVPVISAVAADYFLGETLSVEQVFGGAIALFGVGLILRRSASPPAVAATNEG